MNHRRLLGIALVASSLVLPTPHVARGQATSDQPMARNLKDMTFAAFPGMPTCAPGAVLDGDPAKGPSIIIAKLPVGCTIPWHWHTPNEHVMMVSGVARMDMKDGKPVTLRAGAYAMMPSRHVHQMHCVTACVLYVSSDAPFDIHYVDAQGNEITPDEALKAVKEVAATEPK